MRLKEMSIGTKALAVGAALAVPAPSVALAAPAKPSFDCTKAASQVEKAICASVPPAQADAELTDVYQDRRRTLSAAAARLAVDERRFLAARERVFGFGAKDPAALLLGEIAGRVTVLRSLRIPPRTALPEPGATTPAPSRGTPTTRRYSNEAGLREPVTG
ncbi:lysozyme inhibitor LprI family protein [Methylobacterium bullatum]|uniref:Lysozyme inhibitor LprI-like N-terminal domain-containing protein n=1 Tax=Methylobacterium bullatum TaxID=570505 RepID=A0AAV4Z0Q9_9HYPH|nr:lysozyme inhibitor LprI family protein [Methylobacterium bullatum]MBD8904200.1 hypothetical protein [Methylobacterium bullatum]GJD37760.1 hypothetical protein OICFNHDK_0198 [Methylobacterium bullatum]